MVDQERPLPDDGAVRNAEFVSTEVAAAAGSYENAMTNSMRMMHFLEHPPEVLQYPIYIPDPLSYTAILPDNYASLPLELALPSSPDSATGLNHHGSIAVSASSAQLFNYNLQTSSVPEETIRTEDRRKVSKSRKR